MSTNDSQEGCVFCDLIAKGEFASSTSSAVIFEPLNPVVPGHMLAVPRKHASSAAVDPFGAGDAIEAAAYYLSMHDGMEANLITSIGPHATQTVFHTHVHIIPRFKDDGVVLPWTEQQKALHPPAAPVMRKFRADFDPGDGHALDRNGRQWRVLEVNHGLNSDAGIVSVVDAYRHDVIANGWPVFYFAPNTTTIHLAYPECQDLGLAPHSYGDRMSDKPTFGQTLHRIDGTSHYTVNHGIEGDVEVLIHTQGGNRVMADTISELAPMVLQMSIDDDYLADEDWPLWVEVIPHGD